MKQGGNAVIQYLSRLLEIPINNATIPIDWKTYIVVPLYKGGNRLLVSGPLL
jgi:hypothetical protein